MAFTIEQLQAFSNTKPELRWITEEIIDYLQDNASGGGGGSASYLIYTGFLTQAGTSAPVVTVLENTLGTIVWARTGTGYYVGTLAGAFTNNKTVIPPFATINANDTPAFIGLAGATPFTYCYNFFRQDGDTIILAVYDSVTFDGVELSTVTSAAIFIEIRVYV